MPSACMYETRVRNLHSQTMTSPVEKARRRASKGSREQCSLAIEGQSARTNVARR